MIEIPAFLFCTLCYTILISFSRFGAIAPTTWPLSECLFFILDFTPFLSTGARLTLVIVVVAMNSLVGVCLRLLGGSFPRGGQVFKILVRQESWEIAYVWYWPCRGMYQVHSHLLIQIHSNSDD